jgi:hypothetical protein
MSNFNPASSMLDPLPAILKRDSESGVRLMQTAIFMATKDSLVRWAILVLASVARSAGAQVVETPVAFDSAANVRSVTPALAARLALQPPAWPVSGDYVQARLYAVSTGGTVLVVERPGGTLERYMLADAELASLRTAINAATLVIGNRVGEDRPDVISEPARGAFLRNQMILAAGLYGPLLAALTDDAQTGTVMYLAAVGGSYFILNTISRTTSVTRAQNDLATDGALRGAATAVGLMHAFRGDDFHRKTYSGTALGGAVAGSIVGYFRGRGLTDSEAHSAMKFSTFAAGTALGLAGTFGAFEDDGGAEQVVAGSMVAAGLAGYLLGPAYPRRAPYTVTAGDVRLLPIGALLGALAGATPVADADDTRLIAAGATLGGLAGVWLADRVWAMPYDHGSGDVTQTWLGTIAGGLLGAAAVVLAEPRDAFPALALVTTGAIAGAVAGHHLASPRRAQPRVSWRFTPERGVLALARVPGSYPVVSVSW